MGRVFQSDTRLSAAQAGKDALFQALAKALMILATEETALVVIENLHMADDSTLDFLE